jgi:hypothetical protein
MSESTTDPKLAALEKSLSALVPAPGRIDRDQLLFRAGQASVRGRSWLWPSATALVAIVAVGLGTALMLRPAPRVIERVVFVSPESQAPAGDSTGSAPLPNARTVQNSVENSRELWASSTGYVQQRDQAIRWGVEALPPSASLDSTGPALSIESMLGMPKEKHPSLFPLQF